MSQISSILTAQLGSPSCFCGSREGFSLNQKNLGKEWGMTLTCQSCGTKIKWLSENKIKKVKELTSKPMETAQLGLFA